MAPLRRARRAVHGTGRQGQGFAQQQGWSQTELGERIGADPAQISRYENGRITPSADAVARLAEVFAVSCDYLLVDDAPPPAVPSPRRCARRPPGRLRRARPGRPGAVVRFIEALVHQDPPKLLAAASAEGAGTTVLTMAKKRPRLTSIGGFGGGWDWATASPRTTRRRPGGAAPGRQPAAGRCSAVTDVEIAHAGGSTGRSTARSETVWVSRYRHKPRYEEPAIMPDRSPGGWLSGE